MAGTLPQNLKSTKSMDDLNNNNNHHHYCIRILLQESKLLVTGIHPVVDNFVKTCVRCVKEDPSAFKSLIDELMEVRRKVVVSNFMKASGTWMPGGANRPSFTYLDYMLVWIGNTIVIETRFMYELLWPELCAHCGPVYVHYLRNESDDFKDAHLLARHFINGITEFFQEPLLELVGQIYRLKPDITTAYKLFLMLDTFIHSTPKMQPGGIDLGDAIRNICHGYQEIFFKHLADHHDQLVAFASEDFALFTAKEVMTKKIDVLVQLIRIHDDFRIYEEILPVEILKLYLLNPMLKIVGRVLETHRLNSSHSDSESSQLLSVSLIPAEEVAAPIIQSNNVTTQFLEDFIRNIRRQLLHPSTTYSRKVDAELHENILCLPSLTEQEVQAIFRSCG